jgi:hypothetical protein
MTTADDPPKDALLELAAIRQLPGAGFEMYNENFDPDTAEKLMFRRRLDDGRIDYVVLAIDGNGDSIAGRYSSEDTPLGCTDDAPEPELAVHGSIVDVIAAAVSWPIPLDGERP